MKSDLSAPTMIMQQACFTPFKASIDAYNLPERFTFPFYYEPHPLCVLAVKELKEHLATQRQWQHNFGLNGEAETAIGKMFGVLLVQNKHNEIGYLAAFSGKVADQNHLPGFVPPVFDMLTEDGFFLTGQDDINQINEQIKRLENNPQIAVREAELKAETTASIEQINAHRELMIEGRRDRKLQRITAEKELNQADFEKFNEQLSQQSIQHKNQLRALTAYWNDRVNQAQDKLNQLTDDIAALKTQRKQLSAALQQKLFEQYRFLNQQGEQKSLGDIFKQTSQLTPP
ncbi:MAG: RNA pseudouridine synthase, partial [Gammaproteobacteria bacterium]|nr:RNA pseudouridine synthase [Gammaproteobacteria bacterium]